MNPVSIILTVVMGALLLLFGVGGVLVFSRKRSGQPVTMTAAPAPTANKKPFPWLPLVAITASIAGVYFSSEAWGLISTTETTWYKNPVLLASAAGLIASAIWLMPSNTPSKNKPTKMVIILAGFSLAWYFWPELLTMASEWLATTPTGAKLEIVPKKVIANRWWIDVAFIVIGIIVILTLMPKQPKAKNITITRRGDGVGVIDAILGNVILLLFAAGAATLLAGIGSAFIPDDLFRGKAGTSEVITDCEQGELIDVFPAGREIVICGGTNHIFLVVPPGHALVYDFAPDFKEQHKHRKLRVADYVIIQEPFTYPGSIVGSYKLQRRQSTASYTAGWKQTELKKVVVFVRAVAPK